MPDKIFYLLFTVFRVAIVSFFFTLILFLLNNNLSLLQYFNFFTIILFAFTPIKIILDIKEKNQIEKDITNYEKMLLEKNEKTDSDLNFIRLINQRK